MENSLGTAAVTLAVVLSGQGASAQDLSEGFAAYERDDYAAAIAEWRPLAEHGNADAQRSLGAAHSQGEGVIQDNLYAHMWSNIAASLGDEDAAKNRDVIAQRMTAEDISKAQALARDCVDKDCKDC